MNSINQRIQDLISSFHENTKVYSFVFYKNSEGILEILNLLFEQVLEVGGEFEENDIENGVILLNYYDDKVRLFWVGMDGILIRSFQEKFFGGYKIIDQEEYEPFTVEWNDIKSIKNSRNYINFETKVFKNTIKINKNLVFDEDKDKYFIDSFIELLNKF